MLAPSAALDSLPGYTRAILGEVLDRSPGDDVVYWTPNGWHGFDLVDGAGGKLRLCLTDAAAHAVDVIELSPSGVIYSKASLADVPAAAVAALVLAMRP